jgi:alpha-ketoglutarate-dependent 2,4-dichlorophenoxyacetate dioxygenase
MSLKFEQIGKTFVASVSGIDLRNPITAEQQSTIEAALGRYGVLVFRNQPINDDQQQAFIEKFGPPVLTTLKELATGHPHFYDIGTVDEDGKPIPENSVRGMYLLANLLWHTDGSQNQPPIRLTALHARTLPPDPPPTEYADMCAAWDALPEQRKAGLEGLMVEHSIYWSREKMGMSIDTFSEETRAQRKPVIHPLVRVHPLTGRKSIYLASHASHVIGWPVEEGRTLIEELTEFATQPQFVYSVEWQPHNLVMWDDRWTMHRATPYSAPHPRKMRWCAVRELEPV